MKQTFLLNLSFLILANISLGQVKNINKDSISTDLINKVYVFAFNTFNACENGDFPKLNTQNATRGFITSYNLKKLIPLCEDINETFGSLIKINLAEILKDSTNLIFRYKAKYEKTDRSTEIRIYLNQENKFIGIYSKPYWFDKFYKKNENPPVRKVELASVEQKYIDRTFDFVKSTYNSCDKYSFLKLTEAIATRRLTNSLTDKKIIKSCEESEQELGRLIDFKLTEVLTDDETRIIYRYKSEYTKSKELFEIIVVSNMENKLSGITRRKWFDKFYDLYQEPKENNE